MLENNFLDDLLEEIENKKSNIQKENEEEKQEYNFLNYSKEDNIINNDKNQISKLKQNLEPQPLFDVKIPLLDTDILDLIQKYKDKKISTENYEKIFSEINLLKWLKVYSILLNKKIHSVNATLSQIKKQYSFDSNNGKILCEVKNSFIIDCFQLLDVIDANSKTRNIILTKKVKKNSEDIGKIRLFNENFIDVGDLFLFRKPSNNIVVFFGEIFIELDVKEIQKIDPFGQKVFLGEDD